MNCSDNQNDLADRDTFIGRVVSRYAEPDRSELAAYLRANPGQTVRDWKGKGPSLPFDAERGEASWSKLKADEVRPIAIAASARDLPQNIRQAAARDPALIWNPLARKYRLRQPGDPCPIESSENAAKGTGGDQ